MGRPSTRNQDAASGRLQALFDVSPQPAFVFDLRTLKFLEVNKAALREYGYSRNALLRMKMSDLRAPADRPALSKALAKLGKAVVRWPARHRLKSGRFIDVQIDARLVDWEGRPAVMSVVVDISRQKTMEAELKGARESLGEIIGNVPIVLFSVDQRGILRLAEGKALLVLGRRPGQGVGEPVEAAFADAPQLAQAVKRALKAGATTTTVLLKGRFFETHLAPRVDAQGRRDGLMGVATDVTERKRAEMLLHQQSAAIKASMDGMAILDSGGRFVFLNEAMAAMCGYGSPRELIGKSWQTLYDVAERCRFEDDVLPIVRKTGHWRGEALGRKRDGSVFPQEVSLTSTEEGELVYVVRDITARKDAEAEHARLFALERRARADAEAASRAKDEFLAVVSHELRTPMTAILGWTWLLRSGDVGSADHDKALDVIERNMKLQAQIIEDLLDVSSIVTGKLHLEKRPIDVAKVAESAVETVRSSAQARKVELVLELCAGLTISGDQQRLQQVFWNLLSNAIKFNREGGRVTVRARREGRLAIVTVEDTGSGIGPEFLPDVFDPFRQGEGSLTRKHRGLGIGLAIVRHLVELHGGSVAVSSEGHGKGAAFRLAIPLALADNAPSDGGEDSGPRTSAGRGEEPSKLPHSLDELDVILIDDESDTVEMLAELLKYCGARVRTALSAAEGMRHVIEKAPDLLISDIAMPQEDGYSLIRRIRALGPGRGGDVRALALTARAKDEDREQALEAGFHMYLAKPVDPAALVSTIRKLLAK